LTERRRGRNRRNCWRRIMGISLLDGGGGGAEEEELLEDNRRAIT